MAAKLADYGFNCIKLADDCQGADFLAYHKDGEETLEVQLGILCNSLTLSRTDRIFGSHYAAQAAGGPVSISFGIRNFPYIEFRTQPVTLDAGAQATF